MMAIPSGVLSPRCKDGQTPVSRWHFLAHVREALANVSDNLSVSGLAIHGATIRRLANVRNGWKVDISDIGRLAAYRRL